MTATEQRSFIGFLEEQMKTMETEPTEQLNTAERSIAFHRKDAERSRRMLMSAAIIASVEMLIIAGLLLEFMGGKS